MRENYFKNLKKLLKEAGKAGVLIILLSLVTHIIFAQTTITWTGAVSSDANDAQNWNPQLTPPGNHLYIDTASKFTNLPIWNVDNSVDIDIIETTNYSQFFVNVTYPDSVVNVNTGSSSYYQGTLNIGGQGKISWRKNLYLERSDDTIKLTGGVLETRSYYLIGRKDGSDGSYLYISGDGVFIPKLGMDRFANDSLKSVITIVDNGRIEIPYDWSANALYRVGRNQIKSSPDRDIVVKYESLSNTTVIYSRDKLAFLVEPADNQYVTAGEDGEILRIVDNEGLASMNSLSWRYTTTSGSGYTAFSSPAQTGDTLVPNFGTPGVYYVVCIGDNGVTTDTTNEIKFVVASDKVRVTPDAQQRVKLGRKPYQLTVIEDETATSREWLYTTTSGGGYQSFDPAVTDTFCIPQFNAIGDYYVICESVISGVDHQSKEVKITYVDSLESSDIKWYGNVDSVASDPRNWTPIAEIYKNNLIIDTANYDIEPVLSNPDNDTISDIIVVAGAKFTVEKPEGDTLLKSGSSQAQIDGEMHIISGVYYSNTYQRFENNTSFLDIEGGAYVQGSGGALLIGNKNTAYLDGGMIDIHGTGILFAYENIYGAGIDRWATDTTKSVITIWDEGQLILEGDYKTDVETRVAKNQIKTLDGWELVINFNSADSTTIVTAFDPTAITVIPKDEQILAPDEKADTLFATNTAIYDSLIWKYSTTIGGTLTAFDPIVNDTFAIPSFSEPGDYYVACIGMNDTLTKKSNSVHIIIPDVTVSPDSKQAMRVGETNIVLEVSESPEADARTWKYSATSGGPYNVTTPQITSTVFTPSFAVTGVNYIICESEYNGKAIISNEVEVEVVEIEVSPASDQNITVNSDGTTISVTETPAADSREWMVTSTSGSGYESFAPAETGTDYTPNFAAEGTYYVVCASVYDGATAYSDEITINVGPSAVDNTNANTLALYPNPTTGTFVINETIPSYRVEVYNSQGKLVLSEDYNNVNGPQEITLESKGIYVVNLISEDQVKTSKIIVK